jgi:hypothetical protein
MRYGVLRMEDSVQLKKKAHVESRIWNIRSTTQDPSPKEDPRSSQLPSNSHGGMLVLSTGLGQAPIPYAKTKTG